MAIKDNLQQKIDKARSVGYSDAQIQTYLKGQGITMPVKTDSYAQRVSEDFAGRRQKIEEINKAQLEGKQIFPETVLQHAGQIAGGAVDIVTEAPVIKQGLEILGKGLSNIIKAVPEDIRKKAVDTYNGLPENIKRDIEAGLDIAALIPVGESINVTKQAGKTALRAGELGSEAVSATGRVLKATGETAYQRAITPTVQEAERILKYEAKNPFLTRASNVIRGEESTAPITRAQTAVEKGIVGTEKMVGVQAKRVGDKLWTETINPAIKSSDAVITKDELFEPIIERIFKTTEPGRKQALTDAFDALVDDYKDITKLTLEEAQSIKRGLDEFTPDKVFKGKSVTSEYATLKNDMANAIRQKTYESLKDVNIKKAYLDWANLHELEKIGVKAISEGGLKGGWGSFWSTMWDRATTPIKTIGGQVLYRVGDVLEFVGDKGITNFGEYLRSKGFLSPK